MGLNRPRIFKSSVENIELRSVCRNIRGLQRLSLVQNSPRYSYNVSTCELLSFKFGVVIAITEEFQGLISGEFRIVNNFYTIL